MHHDHDDHDHDHDHHDHDHKHPHAPPQKDHDAGPVGAYELLEEAIRSLLIEKGVLTAQEIAAQVDLMDSRSPALGAKVVAKAWVDADFKKRLLADTRSALAEVGIDIGTLADYRTVENVPGIHNVIVCTLCSCYPKLLLGIPPAWYKSLAYRSRVVVDPRGVLAEFGVELPRGHRGARARFHRRPALPGAAHAPQGHARLERGRPCRPRHPRLHDRHRHPGSSPRASARRRDLHPSSRTRWLQRDPGSTPCSEVPDRSHRSGRGAAAAGPRYPSYCRTCRPAFQSLT